MIRVAISLIAALLGIASTMPQAAAQAVGPDEAHEAPARVRPNVALSPVQKRTIYNAVSQQRPRTSPADIPLVVGALLRNAADAARTRRRRLVGTVPQIRYGGRQCGCS
jgi:hypothetical protein